MTVGTWTLNSGGWKCFRNAGGKGVGRLYNCCGVLENEFEIFQDGSGTLENRHWRLEHVLRMLDHGLGRLHSGFGRLEM